MSKTLYMVVEHFRNGDAVPVYRRFRDRGLLEQWIANWSDLIDFEVYPVISSQEAVERIAPRL
jgi:hypothetical protein